MNADESGEIEAATDELKGELAKSGFEPESASDVLTDAAEVVRDHRKLRDALEELGVSLEAQAAELERDLALVSDAVRARAEEIQALVEDS